MTFNLDTVNGGDSHKRWDIYPPEGVDPVDYVITTLRNPEESVKETVQRVLALPSAQNGMPKALRRGLLRAAAGVPQRDAVTKHLPGLHDQKSHGRRYGTPDLSDLFKVSAGKMYTAFRSAFGPKGKYYGNRGFVTFYSKKQYEGMECFVKYGGKTGGAIKTHPDGRKEAVAVFNNGGPKGAALGLITDLVTDHGVNYLECFGEDLRVKYESIGFHVTESFPFDADELEGYWDFERHNHPNYYLMDYKGVSKSMNEGEAKAILYDEQRQKEIDAMPKGKKRDQAQALLDASKAFA